MPKRRTAALGVLMALVLGTGVVLASHQFPDVPDTNQFHDDIAWLVDNGIAGGYTNGNFGPRTPCPDRRWLRSSITTTPTSIRPSTASPSIVVTKGEGLPIPHAAYSIPLGSPIADTTGGVFRMTCDAERGTLPDRGERRPHFRTPTSAARFASSRACW